MPRQRQLRKIIAPPSFSGFKPYGCAGGCNEDFIELFYEEYEAIKLTDYDLLTYEDSAIMMGVSRATFARIYDSARRKLAEALVNSKEIKTIYGHICLDKEWFLCGDCFTRFNIEPEMEVTNCPACNSSNIHALNNVT